MVESKLVSYCAECAALSLEENYLGDEYADFIIKFYSMILGPELSLMRFNNLASINDDAFIVLAVSLEIDCLNQAYQQFTFLYNTKDKKHFDNFISSNSVRIDAAFDSLSSLQKLLIKMCQQASVLNYSKREAFQDSIDQLLVDIGSIENTDFNRNFLDDFMESHDFITYGVLLTHFLRSLKKQLS